MSFKMKYKIESRLIPAGTKRRPGTKITGGTPNFGVAHDTGNMGSTAAGNVNYYINSRNSMYASAHTFIDDGAIIECIPATTGAPEKAYHVLYNVTTDNRMYGDDANDKAIGVELCFGSNINFNEAYSRFVWYCAYVSYKFQFSPQRWVGHHILDPGRKTDPVNALKRYGKTYEQLLQDIVAEYNACVGKTSASKPTGSSSASSEKPAASSNASTATHTVSKGETLYGIATKYKTTVAAITALNPGINPNVIKVGDKIAVAGSKTPTTSNTPASKSKAGKRVEAKVDLRYYSKPSWSDKDVSGVVKKGYGFTIVEEVTVSGAKQYKVKNSKGSVFYITASDKYVTVK